MKRFRDSRTMVLNTVSAVVAVVIAVATVFAGPEMAALGIPPDVARIASIVLLTANAVNIGLRGVTTEPVKAPWKKDAA